MTRHQALLIGSLTITLAISVILFFLPYPQVVSDVSAKDMGSVVSVDFLAVAIQLDAAILVLLGLKGYKTEFKQVYYLIAAGIVAMTINSIIFTVISFINGLDIGALSFVMSLVGIVLIYLGIYKFARLLAIPHVRRPLIGIGVVAVILGVVAWVLPQNAGNTTALEADLENTCSLIVTVFAGGGAVTAWLIKQQANARYQPALNGLFWALALLTAFYLNNVAVRFVSVPDVLNILISIGGTFGYLLLFLKAAYGLLKSTYDKVEHRRAASIVDVNVYLASLASSPRAIAPIIDPMRMITASRQTNDRDSHDQTKLRLVYEQMKVYLTTKEPLRSFTAKELDELIRLKFGDSWITPDAPNH